MFAQSLIDRLTRLRPPREYPLSNYQRIREELEPCDVVLVEGRSHVSDVIKLVTMSPWSHAALSIGPLNKQTPDVIEHLKGQDLADDEPLLIESVLGSGTLVRPLSIYAQDHLRICRPDGLSPEQTANVIGYAVSRLGVPYDVRHIFDLLRFLLPWALLPRRWRSTLFEQNAGESTRTVCSVMIAEAFGRSEFPILPLIQKGPNDEMEVYRRNPRLFTPSDFDYSPYFQIIKYPFIDVNARRSMQLLPWRGDLSALEDHGRRG
jgi:hypothetical protein